MWQKITCMVVFVLMLCGCAHFGSTLEEGVVSFGHLNYENYRVLAVLQKLVEGVRSEDIILIKSCFDREVASYSGYLENFIFTNCEDLNVVLSDIEISLLEAGKEVAHTSVTDCVFASGDSMHCSIDPKKAMFTKETFEKSTLTAQVFFDYEITGNCEDQETAGVFSSGRQMLQLVKNKNGTWKIVNAVSESKRKGLF